MTDEESLQAAIHEQVQLVPYDPAWTRVFEAERSRLLSLCPGTFVAIEHIGSTAIPQMSAKPIIDLMAGVESLAGAETLSERLCESGYTTSAEFNASLSDRKWFMRWARGRRSDNTIAAHAFDAINRVFSSDRLDATLLRGPLLGMAGRLPPVTRALWRRAAGG